MYEIGHVYVFYQTERVRTLIMAMYSSNRTGKALVTPSYDVVRWGKILDIDDCPRFGYDITILVSWSHWKIWVATFLTTSLRIRRRVVRNPSHMENQTKCIFSHTLHFKSR